MKAISTSKIIKVFPKSVIFRTNRQILVLRKNSPHIFFAGGMVGIVTSTVLACRSTLKLSKKLDEIQSTFNDVEVLKNDSKYPIEEYRRDFIYVYSKATLTIIKLYSPSIVIGVISIGALTGSHVQMSRRNTALMAAYAAVQQAYEEYRNRIRSEIGPERERELYAGITKEITQNEKGELEEIKVFDPNRVSAYARFFDEYSQYWERDPEVNKLYVQCQQNFANDLLQARGHVFLNEVYDMLGIERSSAGQSVGWVIGDDGDNYVNFHIFEAYNSAFVNGHERSILLDFNVDGVIWDKI
ncbi:MAG: DUF6353 family protein [Paenisporosarcina sp.]